jgi:hypothetical protein
MVLHLDKDGEVGISRKYNLKKKKINNIVDFKYRKINLLTLGRF